MSDVSIRLSAATTPVAAAKVFNPIRSEYYLKNVTPQSQPAAPEPDVKVTLSNEAKAALAQSKEATQR
jgi:hypothetical protein